jgi:hypothetical protein
MAARLKLFLVPMLAGIFIHSGQAQDLAPRAYIIAPVHSNAVTLTWAFYNGGINFNGVVPLTGATGTYSVPSFAYTHAFGFFGRSANISVGLPYGVGTFQGELQGTQHNVYRSGLLDLQVRLSVNLMGGPAMEPQQYAKWKQKMLLGASLKVIAPTGQYDPTLLINWGINRWAFKPEFGYSQRWGHWVLDGYAGVWFFTTNNAFFDVPLPRPQSQAPIGSFEGHLSYSFKNPMKWASLDGNFWFGGVDSVNGIANPETKQTSSRIGGTLALPITSHQSLKFSYSSGTYVKFGGNYYNVSVAWQYSWLGRPK